MKAIEELEKNGYLLTATDKAINYEHIGKNPDPDQIRPLLEQIKAAKSEAISYLQQRPFTRKSKKCVIFPARTDLAFPAGTWQRMEDGRIEALLSCEDMKEMLYWRDDVLANPSP